MLKLVQEVDISQVVDQRELKNITTIEFSSYEGCAECFAAAAMWLKENVDKITGGTLVGVDYYTTYDEGAYNLYLFVDSLED